MVKRGAFPLGIQVGFAFLFLPGCGGGDGDIGLYKSVPRQTEEIILTANGQSVEPLRIALVGDTLFVAARGSNHVFLYDAQTFEYLSAVALRTSPAVSSTALAVTAETIVVGDHSRGLVAFFDRRGIFREAFGVLPDGITTLLPMALTEFGGVLYVADVASKSVLAISMVDAEGITEFGELILTIPLPDQTPLGFPSALLVTPDGRLLVGDAREGVVRVFTCDGRDVYRFDPFPGEKTGAPQAMAIDDVPDLSLQDESSFDPSGVRDMGRVHVVDGLNGRIHMFNPLGRYLSSYPLGEKRLAGPSDIAVDLARKRIIVCDPPASRLVIFSYGD